LQGRYAEAEAFAVRSAQRYEPAISQADAGEMAVFGALSLNASGRHVGQRSTERRGDACGLRQNPWQPNQDHLRVPSLLMRVGRVAVLGIESYGFRGALGDARPLTQ
jgi:hypothetical protein